MAGFNCQADIAIVIANERAAAANNGSIGVGAERRRRTAEPGNAGIAAAVAIGGATLKVGNTGATGAKLTIRATRIATGGWVRAASPTETGVGGTATGFGFIAIRANRRRIAAHTGPGRVGKLLLARSVAAGFALMTGGAATTTTRWIRSKPIGCNAFTAAADLAVLAGVSMTAAIALVALIFGGRIEAGCPTDAIAVRTIADAIGTNTRL
jgi:hypothetical protein